MLGNMLFTLLYFSIGTFLAFSAWTGYLNAPPLLLWIGAAIFLIVGLWRFFHLSKG
jgi:hypothetical protein